MILKSERLNLVSLNYEQVFDYVLDKKGFINSDEAQKNVMEQTVVPMSLAPIEEHIFYTIWVGLHKGEDILQCGILRPPNKEKVIEIWYEVNENERGKGFATEAIQELIKWIIEDGTANVIGASVSPENEESKKVLLKCGFRYNCVWDNMEIFYLKIKN